MDTLAKTKFIEPITTLDAFVGVVRCFTNLPEADEVPAGTVGQLIESQSGYICNHLYLCTEKTTDGVTTHEWTDITEDQRCEECPSESGSFLLYEFPWTTLSNKADYVGILSGLWKYDYDRFPDDPWVYSVLRRKLYDFPIDDEDGEEILRSCVRDEYKEDQSYWRFLLQESSEYKYAIFHVHKSGRVFYVRHTAKTYQG